MSELAVLVPYKITLLSNYQEAWAEYRYVLVPYKITLLSNVWKRNPTAGRVLVPYKITLLSNYSAVSSLRFAF